MPADVKARSYRSPRRAEQARATRRDIVAAAHRLFVANGYPATRVEDVAADAGVAIQTVYSSVGNKRQLLWAVVETAAAGDDEPRTIAERMREHVQGGSDPDDRLRRLIALGREIVERSADAHRIMRGAATTDPEVGAALADAEAGRRRDCRTFAELITGDDPLPDGVDLATATDLLFAHTSYEVCDHLTRTCGWTFDTVEHELVRILRPVFVR